MFTVSRIAAKSPHKSPGPGGMVGQCWVVETAFRGLDLNLDFATYQLCDFQQVTELQFPCVKIWMIIHKPLKL